MNLKASNPPIALKISPFLLTYLILIDILILINFLTKIYKNIVEYFNYIDIWRIIMFNEKIQFNIPNCLVHAGNGIHVEKRLLSSNHFHKELEFIYVKDGCTRVFLGDKCCDVNKGEIIFINSNVPHSTECMKEETNQYLLQFSNPSALGCSISYLPNFIKKQEIDFYLFKSDDSDLESVKELIIKINEEKQNEKTAFDYYVTAYVHCITAILHRKNLLLDGNDLINQKQIEKLFPVFEYIDIHYGEHISLEEIGNKIHLNECYLCRLFKDITGSTISDYINYVRIYKAEKMLKKDISLSEIAYQCGFLSLSYFNRVFKKYKSYSPREYRKIMQYREFEG